MAVMRPTLRYFFLLLCCAVASAGPAKRAPNLEFHDLQGKKEEIAGLHGSVAVVNFWATWCGPCREEMPMLTKLAAEYKDKGVRFIAASADKESERAQVVRFVERNPPGVEVWLGASLPMLDRAHMGNMLPATMILDADGNVVSRVMGEAREAEVRAVLDWLIAGRQGAAPPALFMHE